MPQIRLIPSPVSGLLPVLSVLLVTWSNAGRATDCGSYSCSASTTDCSTGSTDICTIDSTSGEVFCELGLYTTTSGTDFCAEDDGTDYLFYGAYDVGGSATTFCCAFDESEVTAFYVYGTDYDDLVLLDAAGGGGTSICGVTDVDVYGWPGDDTIYAVDCTGTCPDDDLQGDEGDDSFYGYGCPESVDAGEGNDFAWGGDGDDVLHGWEGDDLIFGGDGDDYLRGEEGDDTIYGESWLSANQATGCDPSETGDDDIGGGPNSDLIYGCNGSDVIHGDDSGSVNTLWHDVIMGGNGGDTIYGDGGNDDLCGGASIDTLDGGLGTDRLWSRYATTCGFSIESNSLDGGAGSDQCDTCTGTSPRNNCETNLMSKPSTCDET